MAVLPDYQYQKCYQVNEEQKVSAVAIITKSNNINSST